MSAKIAILEGWKMPRHRRRRYGAYHHRRRRYGAAPTGGGHARFRKVAKMCSRIVRHRGGSFRACMRKHLKKKHRR